MTRRYPDDIEIVDGSSNRRRCTAQPASTYALGFQATDQLAELTGIETESDTINTDNFADTESVAEQLGNVA